MNTILKKTLQHILRVNVFKNYGIFELVSFGDTVVKN